MEKLERLDFVAGIVLSGKIYFWKKDYKFYLPQVNRILISYYNIYSNKKLKRDISLSFFQTKLEFPKHLQIYLDNGAFSLIKKSKDFQKEYQKYINEYINFVETAKPYWYPVPMDYIPHPAEDKEIQRRKFEKTMEVNKIYMEKGFVPVIHAGLFFEKFVEEIKKIEPNPKKIAIGGLVPHILLSKNGSRKVVIDTLKLLRDIFPETNIHIFGIGGINTIYLLKLAKVNSFDSIGWRVRAAWGIIQLKGKGERQIMPKNGGWKIPPLSQEDKEFLKKCKCPICSHGLQNLMEERGSLGFEARAIHNLYTLSEEVNYINSLKNKKQLLKYIEKTIRSKFILKIVKSLL